MKKKCPGAPGYRLAPKPAKPLFDAGHTVDSPGITDFLRTPKALSTGSWLNIYLKQGSHTH